MELKKQIFSLESAMISKSVSNKLYVNKSFKKRLVINIGDSLVKRIFLRTCMKVIECSGIANYSL